MLIIKTKTGWMYVDTAVREDNGIKFNDKYSRYKQTVEDHWKEHHGRATTPSGQ